MDLATTVDTTKYLAIPFDPSPPRYAIISYLMRSLCRLETVFSDYTRICDDACFDCPKCNLSLSQAARIFSNPSTSVLEVWQMDDAEAEFPVGVILLLPITVSEMHVHFAFFDGKLKGKKELMESLVEWVFAEREGWKPPMRLTAEVPDYAFALAKFAHREMGFGGDFVYRHKGHAIQVEGIKKNAILWRGVPRDVLVLGRTRGDN